MTRTDSHFATRIHAAGFPAACSFPDAVHFYSSIESALDELAALLRGEARELYPQFSDRLAGVEQMSGGIGWGFHDFIADLVGRLEEAFATP